MQEPDHASQASHSDKRGSVIARRSVMKACGAGVVGSVASFSATAAADRDVPYDGGCTTVIDNLDGEEFAEVYTAVTGPKQVVKTLSPAEINMALAMPVSYCDSTCEEGLDNVEIRCELTNNPIEAGEGFDFRRIDPYGPGEKRDGLFSSLPVLTDLFSGLGGTSVSNSGGEFCIERCGHTGVSAPSADWEVDFGIGSDTENVPVGDWVWELTASADVGYWDSMHSRGPGFQVLGAFTHTHEIEVTVVDSD